MLYHSLVVLRAYYCVICLLPKGGPPLRIVLVGLLGAALFAVAVTVGEADGEVAVDVLRAVVGPRVRVQHALGEHGDAGEDRRVPLDDVFLVMSAFLPFLFFFPQPNSFEGPSSQPTHRQLVCLLSLWGKSPENMQRGAMRSPSSKQEEQPL